MFIPNLHITHTGLSWVAASLMAAVAANFYFRHKRSRGPRGVSNARTRWYKAFLPPRCLATAAGSSLEAQEHPTQREQGAAVDAHGKQVDHPAAGLLGDLAESPDVPEAFTDPITFAVMHDPVVLCATGQVYHYSSLREWLATGQRKCPKTNLPLVDVEVVRLPLLRQAVHAWMEQHCLPIPQQKVTQEVLAAVDPCCPKWVAALRCGDVAKRGIEGAAKVNDALISWTLDTKADDQLRKHREAAMEYVMDDLVWLLRHGDSYGQGVACAALSQYQTDEQRQWLAATAAVPACLLLSSPDEYACHAASRLLSGIARVHRHMPGLLCSAGAVAGLLAQVDIARPFPYARCSAALTLHSIAVDPEGRGIEAIRRAGGVDLLLRLVTLPEGQGVQAGLAGADGRREYLCRYEKRDASSALLELRVTEDELQKKGVTRDQLCMYHNCSQAWLYGEVESPEEAYTTAELERLTLEQAEALLGGPAAAAEAALMEAEDARQAPAQGGEEAGAAPDDDHR